MVNVPLKANPACRPRVVGKAQLDQFAEHALPPDAMAPSVRQPERGRVCRPGKPLPEPWSTSQTLQFKRESLSINTCRKCVQPGRPPQISRRKGQADTPRMSSLNKLLPELELAIARGSPKRRSEMLFSVLDVFANGADRFSDDEIALFDDIIMRLAVEIEMAAREKLAQRLAPIAKAPLNIIHMLACDDEIRVARPILSDSVRIDETVLAQVAKSQSQAHLIAISQRKSLGEIITDILVERGNREVLLTVSKNLNAKFSTLGFSRLVKRSEGDDALAMIVGSRLDIPRPLLIILLTTASELAREKLMSERRYASDEIQEAIKAAISRLGDGRNSSGHPSGAKSDFDGLSEVRKFADAGQFDKAIEALAHQCGAPIDAVKDAIARDRIETLLVLARAAGLSWGFTKSLLMSPGRSPGLPPAELDRHRSSFEHLATRTARQIIEFYKLRTANGSAKLM